MHKKESSKVPEVERQGWNVKKLNEESSNQESDDTLRRILRGNENKGNPDERDIAGSADFNETPHGREEAKNNTRSKANNNG